MAFGALLYVTGPQPAGELAYPATCEKRTVNGEFRVSSQVSFDANCEYFNDNNYDPFASGSITADGQTFTERCEDNVLTEYSCSGQTYTVTTGSCSLGCNDGTCIKSVTKTICEPVI